MRIREEYSISCHLGTVSIFPINYDTMIEQVVPENPKESFL